MNTVYSFELNNAHKDTAFVNNNIKNTSPIVEVFRAMTAGNDLSKFGQVADKSVEYIKNLATKAGQGDWASACELNTIRKYSIEPQLLQEIKLLGIFGTYQALGFDESIEVETYSHEGEKSRMQALNGDVPFPIIAKSKYTVSSVPVSGGYAVDYRRVQLGDMSKENEGMEQVKTEIRNRASKYVMDTVYNSIKNATGIKYFFEDNGLTKTNLDKVLTSVRRFGKPNITGDYAVVSKINQFVPYNNTTLSLSGISDSAMDEIRRNGFIMDYNGSIVSEIPNGYDFTSVNSTGDNFATLLPQNLIYVLPTGGRSPIRTWTRGGLTSFTGNDVTTGKVMTRFDLEVAADVAKGREYEIGLIKDTSISD